MEKYYYAQASIPLNLQESTDVKAINEFGCAGIEDFSIDEETVDSILGEKSYSGGDIPDQEIFKVEKEVSSKIKKYYFNSKLEAEVFIDYLSKFSFGHAHLVEKEVKDWNEEWKKSYERIKINRDLSIVPSWDKKEEVKVNELYIYPGMGFGTGSHETTYLCLKFLDQIDVSIIKDCMDFGCGSGILGLALFKLNPKAYVHLYDIDPQALENTVQNIELNEFSVKNFNLILPNDYSTVFEAKCDLVFANILLQTLKSESHKILSHMEVGKHLILSGLLRGQEEEAISHYQKINEKLVVKDTAFKGDWAAVLLEWVE